LKHSRLKTKLAEAAHHGGHVERRVDSVTGTRVVKRELEQRLVAGLLPARPSATRAGSGPRSLSKWGDGARFFIRDYSAGTDPRAA